MSELRTEQHPLTPVTCKDLCDAVQEVGGLSETNFQRLYTLLEHLAPVAGTFGIESVPAGMSTDYPPEEVRQAWIGMVLPVRVMDVLVDNRPGIAVNAAEAIEVLRRSIYLTKGSSRAKQADAYFWWRGYYKQKLSEYGMVKEDMSDYEKGFIEYYCHIENADFLFFDPSCGTYYPIGVVNCFGQFDNN